MQPLQIPNEVDSGEEVVYVSPIRKGRKHSNRRNGNPGNNERTQYHRRRSIVLGGIDHPREKYVPALKSAKRCINDSSAPSNQNHARISRSEYASEDGENKNPNQACRNTTKSNTVDNAQSQCPVTATLFHDDDHFSDTLSDKYPSPPGPDDGIQRHNSFPLLVVQALSKYIFLNDIGGAELALRSLRALSIDVNEHPVISKYGGIRVALEAMDHFPRKPNIQQLAVLFLTDMSRTSNANKLEIGRSGGLQLLNKILLEENTSDPSILERVCIALRTLCDNCEYNAILSGICGTIEAVLKTMRRWKRNGTIQERSFDFLTTVLRDAPENAATMTDAGTVSEILSTIRQYSANLTIQVSALRAACELARVSDMAREHLGCSGLLDDIATGLKSFDENMDYIHSASRCIRYLAISRENRLRFGNSTITTLVLARMESCRRNRRVSVSLLLALANITYDSDRGKANAARGGGIQTLLSTMETHAGDVTVVEAVCRVLRNLSDSSVGTKRVVGRAGTILKVASVMKRHVDSAGIQEHACAMMINLTDPYEAQVRHAGLEQHLRDVCGKLHASDDSYKQADYLYRRLYKPITRGSSASANTSTSSNGDNSDHCVVRCVGTRSVPFAAKLKMGNTFVGQQVESDGETMADKRATVGAAGHTRGERRGRHSLLNLGERTLSRRRSIASNQKEAQKMTIDHDSSKAIAATTGSQGGSE